MRIFRGIKMNGGMTYVELIVVLAIFAVLSSVSVYNYNLFESSVDIKNLASDIALQVVQAQNSSLNGLLPPVGYSYDPVDWKPSYGVYFDISTPRQFIYFVDLSSVTNGYNFGEELNTLDIVKGNNYISGIDGCYNSVDACEPIGALSITFRRPDSGAILSDVNGERLTKFDYTQITVASPNNKTTAKIKLYPSGRVQIN
jgi:prepilin-type N-terminal cleavage/methylation domain-containing protein